MRFHYLDIWKINSNHIGIHFSFLHRPFFSQYTSAHPCSLHSILSATPVQLFTTSEKRLYSSFFYEYFLLLKCQLCDCKFSFFNNQQNENKFSKRIESQFGDMNKLNCRGHNALNENSLLTSPAVTIETDSGITTLMHFKHYVFIIIIIIIITTIIISIIIIIIILLLYHYYYYYYYYFHLFIVYIHVYCIKAGWARHFIIYELKGHHQKNQLLITKDVASIP